MLTVQVLHSASLYTCNTVIVLIDIPYTAFPIFFLLSQPSNFNKLQHSSNSSAALINRCNPLKTMKSYLNICIWLFSHYEICSKKKSV